MKRVLMVAFQFPPFAGSSAVQRMLRFVQQLPSYGWEPIVLTATPRAYENTSTDLLDSVPSNVVVERAFAFNAVRLLSVAGRYPSFAARPDWWSNWRIAGVRAGRRLVSRYKPDVIWSTYPIPTAHVIGGRLHADCGLPWIADFRDPMAQDGYPSDPATWQSFKRIEEEALVHARFSVFTTPGAAAMYRERYPGISADRIAVIENGYDESSFAALSAARAKEPLAPGRLTLLHSGAIYSSERDPTHFFEALGRLRRAGRIGPDRVSIRFRASSNDALLRALSRRHVVEDIVELLPAVPYLEALEEMSRADGLVVLQAASCNQQIPAKLYEYLRAGRPMLGITDPAGDTAHVMRRAGIPDIVPLDDTRLIEGVLGSWIEAIVAKRAAIPDTEQVSRDSRVARAGELAALLDRSISGQVGRSALKRLHGPMNFDFN